MNRHSSINEASAEVNITQGIHGASVLGTFIHALTWDQTLSLVSDWAKRRESRTVCFCNVHSVISTQHEPSFAEALSHADLALPDGMPVAWMLRHLGFPVQQRINGPDFTWAFCKLAAQQGISVYFYGSTDDTLAKLKNKLITEFPSLRIAGMVSPPFRALSEEEQQRAVHEINQSGAGAVFVGLGCPKQEVWMNRYKSSINAVTLGVGAAFDYHAGTIKRAPRWMQKTGLEWLARLLSEPRRLWRRYLVTNTLFVLGATAQLLRKSK